MLNRKTAPAYSKIESLQFPNYKEIITGNNLSIYSLVAGLEPVIKIDMVFNASQYTQEKRGVAGFLANMLSEGTKTKSAIELADKLDYYGSYFQVRSGPEDMVVSLFCLEKHLQNCLPLFFEAICESVFPEKELEILKKNTIQKLKVSNKKNSYLCRKAFYQSLLGLNHPIAAFSEPQEITDINRIDLINEHKKQVLLGFKYLIVSGNYSDESLKIISALLQKSGLEKSNNETKSIDVVTSPGIHFIPRNETVQSSIRIGCESIKRDHPEFRKLQFLNLILGGYFGSRLMKNIREDKGLTYGIYSSIEPFKTVGLWYIDCELNYKNRVAGIEEILNEIKKIQLELVPIEELETAKNYYIGSFLKSLDGPFSIANRLKIMIDNNLDNNYYSDFIEIIKNISSDELQSLSKKYLDENKLIQIIVGKE
jgi:zinc protease